MNFATTSALAIRKTNVSHIVVAHRRFLDCPLTPRRIEERGDLKLIAHAGSSGQVCPPPNGQSTQSA
jgi:hypothetical protein